MKNPQRFWRSFLSVALAILWSGAPSKAEQAAAGQEYRWVNSLTAFSFSQLKPAETISWIVGQVRPGKNSGTLHIQSGYIDADSGQFVNKPVGTGQDFSELFGTVQISQTLNGKALPQTLEYRWRETTSGVRRGRRPLGQQNQNFTQAFRGGATVIMAVDSSKAGRDRFGTVFLLPTQWEAFVAPAYRAYTAEPTLFDVAKVSTNAGKLKISLDSANPFIAIAATRTLAQTNRLGQDFVTDTLTRSRGLRQATFTALFIGQGADKVALGALQTGEPFAPLVASLVSAQPVSGLKNLLLGVLAGKGATTRDPFDQKTPLQGFGPTLLRAIAARTRELKRTQPKSQDERELLALLQGVGLR